MPRPLPGRRVHRGPERHEDGSALLLRRHFASAGREAVPVQHHLLHLLLLEEAGAGQGLVEEEGL
eukprot:11094496-Alexandrium_andersonii.AAC.1